MSGMSGRRNCRKCVICNIHEYGSSKKDLFFTSFPLDETRCKEWLRLVGVEELVFLPIEKLHKTRYICGDHFEPRAFNRKGNRLKKWAIPKLNLKSKPLTDEQLSEFPQHMWNYKGVPVSEEASTSTSSVIKSMTDHENVPVPKAAPSTSQSSLIMSVVELGNVSVPEAAPTTSKSSLILSVVDHGNESTLQNKNTQDVESESKRKLHEDLEATPQHKTSEDVGSKTKKRKLDEGLEMTPRKKKLVKQLKKTKCTLASLRRSANLIENIESPVLKEIVISACTNQERKLKGRRWTTKNKISALAIYKRSPKTYRYLRHLIPLPSVKTLQNVLHKIPMEPGINKAVIKHLTTVYKDKDEKDLLCSLLFDEIAIKPRLLYNDASDQVDGFVDIGETEDGTGRSGEYCDHALVFMLQGIRQKFKQPIAFYFVKGTVSSQSLSTIIKNIINAVTETGFKIIATVCDQGPTNMGALKLLRDFSGPSENNSQNVFNVGNDQVYIIYDIPHLFKSIRNNFLNHGILIFNGKKAKWSHLVKVEEKNRSFLYLSKISSTHVNPKYRTKMRVKLAAQILSNTVAAILKLMSQAEKEPIASELMETALVIQELDRLFDYTNGPSCQNDIKKGLRQNVSNKTDHLNVWVDFIKKISTLKFINEKTGNEAKNVKCVGGYLISLQSLRDIWLKVSALGFKYLNLRQLNQDALENLFGVIRQHSPTNRNPTCAHFVAALKTSIVSRLTAPHSRGSNCEKDNKNLLTDFHELIFKDNDTALSSQVDDKTEKEAVSNVPILILPKDKEAASNVPVLSLPEEEEEAIENDLAEVSEQPVVYISGYLAYRVFKKKRECDQCAMSLTVANPDKEDPMYSYIKLREWWKDRTALTYPSLDFCRLVQCATHIIENEICPRLHEKHICLLAVTIFTAKCDTSWFLCAPHKKEIFNKIFVRLGQLLIRRQCQRINMGLALREEQLADANKIAQQQGIAK